MTEDRPGYSFNPGPPPDVSSFFRNKGIRPGFSYLDVEAEEHAVAFTVAKMAQIDMLEAAKSEVQRAIDEGLTFRQFQKNFRTRPELKDWWGRAVQSDPVTGEVREVQLGSPRRLRTIYRANLRSARSAGQWARIERTKKAFPYLEYRLGPSERHRPAHAAKEGLILPVNDPFWDSWMPPNGWGCNCWVRQLTRAEAERRGVSAAPEVPAREMINERTGESRMVPAGIDPGWERNPGKLRQDALEKLLDGRLATASEGIARAAVRDMATSWRVQRLLQGTAGGKVSVAILPPDIGADIGTQARFVKITDDYGRKVGTKTAPVTAEVMGRVSDAVMTGPLAWDTSKGRSDLLVFVEGPEPWLAVIKSLAGRSELWIRTIHRTTNRKWRADLAKPGVKLLRR